MLCFVWLARKMWVKKEIGVLNLGVLIFGVSIVGDKIILGFWR